MPDEIVQELETEEDLAAVIQGEGDDLPTSSKEKMASIAPPSLQQIVNRTTLASTEESEYEESEIESESDGSEYEQSQELSSNVDGNTNIFDIISRSGMNVEVTCPCCEKSFIGKKRCATCDAFVHDVPTCSTFCEHKEASNVFFVRSNLPLFSIENKVCRERRSKHRKCLNGPIRDSRQHTLGTMY